MGNLGDDLKGEVKDLFGSWDFKDGRKIPNQEDIGLGRVGTKIEGVVLYADLADSTGLVRGYTDWFAAAVTKAFLLCSVRVIRHNGGKIISFDGDRVMGIFYGNSKNSSAAIAGQQINYCVSRIIRPIISNKYPKNKFHVDHCVGIDRSNLTAVRAGIRGNNDLIWLGKAANYAAFLSDRRYSCKTCITHRVYGKLNDRAKFVDGDKDKGNKWIQQTVPIKGVDVTCYKSSYWSPI